MSKKLNIVHVDDSETIRSMVMRQLVNHHSVKLVSSVETILEAKEVLNESNIDIAILDIGLKEGNGISLLQWIKENYPNTLVIMFTNHSDDFFKQAAKRVGAEYFLDKSYDFNRILEIISGIGDFYLSELSNC